MISHEEAIEIQIPTKQKTTYLDNIRRHSAERFIKPSRRILIIDDDLDFADSLKYVVESYGNSTCEIINEPYEALLALSDKSFDLIFIDQQLPGMEGSSVLTEVDHQIGKDPLIVDSGRYFTPTPVVIMSGAPVELKNNYCLANFSLLEILYKKNILGFLAQSFAS